MSQNRKCKLCGNEYDPYESTSNFYLTFCTETCESKYAPDTEPTLAIYMCTTPLRIRIYDGEESNRYEMVEESTKWQRDDNQNKGLQPIHLVNVSGRVNERIAWVEVNEQTLAQHFRRI